MASYQSRQRDPLFDSTTQAALEKRSRELVGLALIVTGALFAVVIGTYSPDDPSWISATDAPVQNWLGHFGGLGRRALDDGDRAGGLGSLPPR